jgi:hypothetical protein
MKDKDQVAIFESYREDILSKFKKSLEGEKKEESPIEPEASDEISGEISDEVPEMEDKEEISGDDSDLGSDIEEVDDMEDERIELPKKNVIVKSQELSVDIGPELREIVRRMPEVIEDTEVLGSIKAAIKDINDDLDIADHIKDTPLGIYDRLIASGVYSEEEMDSDEFEDKESEVLQNAEDDDYFDDDDVTGESEFDVSKKSRKEREDFDFRSGMRSDVEKSKAEEILRGMGVDFGERGNLENDY